MPIQKQKPITDCYFNQDNIVIHQDDILKATGIEKSSIDLIVTSPPYNVDIYYNSNKDDLSYENYLEFTKKWIKKCYDLARDDGRFCLNIPLDKNKGGTASRLCRYNKYRQKNRLELPLNYYLA